MPPADHRVRNVFIWPGVVSVALWIIAIVIAGMQFVLVTEAARAAEDGERIPSAFLGLPLFEGFHEMGRFGVHPEWGLLVLLVVPAVVGIVMTLIGVRGIRRRA